jgi:hypothetical protein
MNLVSKAPLKNVYMVRSKQDHPPAGDSPHRMIHRRPHALLYHLPGNYFQGLRTLKASTCRCTQELSCNAVGWQAFRDWDRAQFSSMSTPQAYRNVCKSAYWATYDHDDRMGTCTDYIIPRLSMNVRTLGVSRNSQ